MKKKTKNEHPHPVTESVHKRPKTKKDSETNELYIDSWSALSEYLRYAPDLLKKVVHPGHDDAKLSAILSSLPEGRRPLTQIGDKFMAEVVMPWASEEDVVAYAQMSNSALIIVCDHVTDTRNLGAIARSAAYFGAKFIVMPKDRQAPITSATLSAAQGAFALIRPIQVTNISRFLREIQGHGFWVAVADMNGQNVDEMPHTYEKLALVLGSETRGVSKIVRELADMTLSVVPPAPLLESLNVSVASAVLLHSLTKPRRSQSKSNQ